MQRQIKKPKAVLQGCGYNRDNWPYFELIDAILGDRPATRPPVVVDTTIQAVSDGSPEQSTSSTPRSTARSNSSVDVIPPVDCEDCGGDIDDIEDGVEDGVEEQEEGAEEGAEEGQPTTSGTTAGQRRSSSAQGLPTSKRAKKTGIERALLSFTDAFLQHQKDFEERMMMEEERWRREDMDRMEKIRKDDREHELRLFQLLSMGPTMGSATLYYIPPGHPSSVPIPESMPPSPYPPSAMYPATPTTAAGSVPEQSNNTHLHAVISTCGTCVCVHVCRH